MVDDILVTGYDDVPVNKIMLRTAISAVEAFFSNEGMNEAKYCFDTILDFVNNTAFIAAKDVNEKAGATQDEVNTATSNLNAAFTALKATALDFSALETSIAAAEEYKTHVLVKEAYDKAVIIITDGVLDYTDWECAMQSDVDAQTAALNQAVEDAQNVCDPAIDPECVSINEPIVAQRLSPNPADDYIRITDVDGGNVYISNAAGQQVLSVTNYNGAAINISNLSAGVYTAAFGNKVASFIKK